MYKLHVEPVHKLSSKGNPMKVYEISAIDEKGKKVVIQSPYINFQGEAIMSVCNIELIDKISK